MLGQAPLTVIRPSKGWFTIRLREIWHYRELLLTLTARDIKVRYKQTLIGAGWAILQPLFTMLVFTIFFGRLAKIPSEGLPYPVFYFAALLPWMYFANALTAATNVVVEHQRVITKVYFPRILLPMSAVLSGLVDFAIGFVMLLAILFYYQVFPSMSILLLPIALLLALLSALAVGMWLSALNAVYRDVRYVTPFLVQFWMFASPVVYPSSLVPEQWRWLYGLNPMAGVIESFRWALTGQGDPPGTVLIASVVGVMLVLAGGVLYFQRMERTIADVL